MKPLLFVVAAGALFAAGVAFAAADPASTVPCTDVSPASVVVDGKVVNLSCPAPASSTTSTSLPATSSTDGATSLTTTSPTTTTMVMPPTTAPAPPTTTAAGVLYANDFAAPADMARIVTVVNSGDHRPPDHPKDFMADHDMGCAAPPSTRPLHEDDTAATHVYYCAPGGPSTGHFMTAMDTAGYVTISISPGASGRATIFPGTANRFCWDQNLTDIGGRKWVQVAVVSDDHYAAHNGELDYANPGFAMNTPAMVQMSGDDFLFVGLGNSVQYFVGQTQTEAWFVGYFGSTDKASRFTTCLRDNGDGTITRTQNRPGGGVDVHTGPGAFPAGPRVFILEDDSYNPEKDYAGAVPSDQAPFTWHFDNLKVSAS